MFILIDTKSGRKRMRKKAAIKDVYFCEIEKCVMITFYGKNLCPLKSILGVEEFYNKHCLR